MIVMKKSDPNSIRFVMDISTTRLFSVHAYLVSGVGTIKVSQSNFTETSRYENITDLNLDQVKPENRNAIVSVKDAPCKYFMIELDTSDTATVVELEIIYK